MGRRSTQLERLTAWLFILNLALQAADFAATYVGCRVGFHEGNPLVRQAMECLGPGLGLAAAKCAALLFLAYLWAVRTNRLVPAALTVTAVAYVTLAIVPWSVALLHLRV